MEAIIREDGEPYEYDQVLSIDREYEEVEGGGESVLKVTHIPPGYDEQTTEEIPNGVVDYCSLTMEEKVGYI